MIKSILTDVMSNRTIFRPRVLIAVPSGITAVERRAVEEAALHAGARSVVFPTIFKVFRKPCKTPYHEKCGNGVFPKDFQGF